MHSSRVTFRRLTFFALYGFIFIIILSVIFPYGYRRKYHAEPLLTGHVEPIPRSLFLKEPKILSDNFKSNVKCLVGKDINWKMVTFIKSSADNFERRELMRKTWGSISYLDGAKFDVVFLIGKTDNPLVTKRLDGEELKYNDILQFDGPDDYNNMSYKVLAGMEWAIEHLSEDTFYSSADDDFVVQMKDLVIAVNNVIQKTNEGDSHKNGLNNNGNIIPIMCMFIGGGLERPMRVYGLKWYISFDEYDHDFYPPFCHGGMYTMSKTMAKKLWTEAQTAPMLQMDDVWITGILRKRINVSDDLVYKMPYVAWHFGPANASIRRSIEKTWAVIESAFRNTTICKHER